jgi:propanol-preferring alcohol dehydrogenase
VTSDASPGGPDGRRTEAVMYNWRQVAPKTRAPGGLHARHAITRVGPLTDESDPLTAIDVPTPVPAADEVLIRVRACGVCHTDLDEVEGRLPLSTLPRIPGHQIVGTVETCGDHVTGLEPGTRVGVAWLARTCGHCRFCRSGRENLCPDFAGTGRDVDGGYAEYAVAAADAVHPLPDGFSDVEAAPLLCAGAIGFRALALARISDGEPLGLTGFGASAHLVLPLARHRYPQSPIFVFARDRGDQQFARRLGAAWAGDTAATPPAPLAAIIDTTPAWRPVVCALRHLDRGGRLVINAIRKDDRDKAELLALDYARDLWLEREVASVANVTRADVRGFLDAAAAMSLHPTVDTLPLERAGDAIRLVARGGRPGALVLTLP